MNFETAVNWSAILPLTIPIIAIVMGIGLAIIAIILDFRKKSALFELHHKERMLAIERGMEIPPLPADFYGSVGRHGGCRGRGRYSGIVMLFVGVAAFTAMYANGNSQGAWWALVLVAVGLGRLLQGFLEERDARGTGKQSGPTAPGGPQ
jgi:hypothetical protein